MRKKLLPLLFLLIPIVSVAQSQMNDSLHVESLLKKAKVATFYSSSYSNGWDELQLAMRYTDSAEAIVNKRGFSQATISSYQRIILGLREEHEVSESIAADNINYIYPVSSLMSGHRDDFIIKDDAEELLLESLIEKVLSQNDPLNKGKISENIDFIVFQVEPYNATLLLVAADFINSQSGHYVIRHHEFNEILGEEGLNRFKKDSLLTEDWDAIFNYYGIDKILNLKAKDQGSIIPGLFYKGISINAVEKGHSPEYIGYFEGFKVDKISSWNNAIGVVSGNFLLGLIGLFMMMSLQFSEKRGKGIQIGGYNVSFLVRAVTLKETIIIGISALVSVLGVQYLGNQLAPEINAFYQDSSVRIWVVFQSVVPFLASALITYLVLFKLPNIVVNNASAYSRILFASWMSQLIVLSYYEYHAELFPIGILNYINWIPSVGLAFLSGLLGIILNKLFKQERVTRLGMGMLIVGFLFAFVSFWLELRESYFIANIAYLLLAAISLWMLLNPLRVGLSVTLGESETTNTKSGLSNPVKWYTQGLNVESLKNQLSEFILADDVNQRLFILQGNSGLGKTRFLNECISHFRNTEANIKWFQGDCNQVVEGTAPLYEPFYEAFTLNGEQIDIHLPKEQRSLPQGFFTDRSQLSKAFGTVISHAGSVAPVDIANLLSIEDESSRSIQEIVSELLDALITQYLDSSLSKIVIVIDDFHWIDQASMDVLTELFVKSKARTKYAKYFKFIVTIAPDQEPEEGISKSRLQALTKGNSENDHEIEVNQIKVDDRSAFISQILSETSFKLERSIAYNYRFGPLLKHHLQSLISSMNASFIPGDFLGYLEALEKQEFLKFDGEVIRLLREPKEDEIGLQDSRRAILKAEFEDLEHEHRALLESAAIVGYKFDAELLARIWNKDFLTILSDLEKLEGNFVLDLSQEDNIYAFTHKTLYRVILESANGNKEKDDSRQLIIEYQKRIIKNIIEDHEDDYVEGLDLDMLMSASERCFKYSHVQYIQENTSLIVLHTAKKLAVLGKRDQCLKYLKRLYTSNDGFSSRELLIIVQTLAELTKGSRLISDFEFTRNDDNQVAFIDHVYNKARQNSSRETDYENDAFSIIVVVMMGGIMQWIRNHNKQNKECTIHNIHEYIKPNIEADHYSDRLINRYNVIRGLIVNEEIQNKKALSRLNFYDHIATGGDFGVLPNQFKNAISLEYRGLAGEIGREIYFSSGFDEGTRLKYLNAALELLADNEVTVEKIDSYEVDKKSVEKSIDKIIKAKNLTSKEAQDFNFLLSRFREHFFGLKDFEYVIVLSDIAMELSKRLNDEVGITLSYSYKGAALFHLEKLQLSENVYQAYFEFAIRVSRDVNKFLYPLEGILRIAKITGDYETFNRLKLELYEHLIILDKQAIDDVLRHSLFDKESTFSYLLSELPQFEMKDELVDEDANDVFLDVLRILVLLASVDGKIEINEEYDLRESVIAVSHSLNLSKSKMLKLIPTELKKALDNSWEQNKEGFIEASLNIKSKRSSQYLSSVLGLCQDLAMADEKLVKSERILLEAGRELID